MEVIMARQGFRQALTTRRTPHLTVRVLLRTHTALARTTIVMVLCLSITPHALYWYHRDSHRKPVLTIFYRKSGRLPIAPRCCAVLPLPLPQALAA